MRLAKDNIQFPVKLYVMLNEAEKKGFHHIISWMPDGEAFRIHDPEGLTQILGMFYKLTKFKSFLRQLQNYGFQRVLKGYGKGICKHEMFSRAKPAQAGHIKRRNFLAGGDSNSSLQKLAREKISFHSQSAPTLVTESSSVDLEPKSFSSTMNSKFCIMSAPGLQVNKSLEEETALLLSECDLVVQNFEAEFLKLSYTAKAFTGMGSTCQAEEVGFFEGRKFYVLP